MSAVHKVESSTLCLFTNWYFALPSISPSPPPCRVINWGRKIPALSTPSRTAYLKIAFSTDRDKHHWIIFLSLPQEGCEYFFFLQAATVLRQDTQSNAGKWERFLRRCFFLGIWAVLTNQSVLVLGWRCRYLFPLAWSCCRLANPPRPPFSCLLSSKTSSTLSVTSAHALSARVQALAHAEQQLPTFIEKKSALARSTQGVRMHARMYTTDPLW